MERKLFKHTHKKNSKRKNQNVKELSNMMLKKLQYIGTRIYSLDTIYQKKEIGVQGENLEEKKKERKKINQKTQLS